LMWARVKAQDGACPSCGSRSRRVHSRYDRKLADVAVAGQPVMLRLRVRRFFCGNENCPAATFAEQVGDLTVRHARRTSLCRTVLEHIGLALAGPGRAWRPSLGWWRAGERCWGWCARCPIPRWGR